MSAAARASSPAGAELRPGALPVAAVMEANTGQSLGAETWREGRERQAALLAQTNHLADALERNGIVVRQPAAGVVAVGDVTGHMEEVGGFRAVRFLPLIAQRDRAAMLSGMRFFRANDPAGRFTRMAVVTSGDRVPLLGDLRGRQTKHAKAISRWAAEARRDFGVDVLYRGTEFTTTDAGIHWHSHVLYRPRRALSPARWDSFLSWTKARLGGVHWQDCGRLEKPEEAIKYAFKPAELVVQPDAVVAWLYRETQRLKLAQPMGAFADFLRELADAGEKVAMVHQGDGQGAKLCRVARDRREPREDKPAGGGAMPENILLTRMLPQPRFSPYAEPVSLVVNFTTQPETPDGRRRLAMLRDRQAQARTWWDANGAPEPAVAVAVGEGRAAAEPGHAGAVLPLRRPDPPGAFKVHTVRPTAQTRSPPPGRPPSRPGALAGPPPGAGARGGPEPLCTPPSAFQEHHEPGRRVRALADLRDREAARGTVAELLPDTWWAADCRRTRAENANG